MPGRRSLLHQRMFHEQKSVPEAGDCKAKVEMCDEARAANVNERAVPTPVGKDQMSSQALEGEEAHRGNQLKQNDISS